LKVAWDPIVWADPPLSKVTLSTKSHHVKLKFEIKFQTISVVLWITVYE
jgi:hypothetical protein